MLIKKMFFIFGWGKSTHSLDLKIFFIPDQKMTKNTFKIMNTLESLVLAKNINVYVCYYYTLIWILPLYFFQSLCNIAAPNIFYITEKSSLCVLCDEYI